MRVLVSGSASFTGSHIRLNTFQGPARVSSVDKLWATGLPASNFHDGCAPRLNLFSRKTPEYADRTDRIGLKSAASRREGRHLASKNLLSDGVLPQFFRSTCS